MMMLKCPVGVGVDGRPTATDQRRTTRSSWYMVSWRAERSTSTRRCSGARRTCEPLIHPVEPLGRRGSRTCSQPRALALAPAAPDGWSSRKTVRSPEGCLAGNTPSTRLPSGANQAVTSVVAWAAQATTVDAFGGVGAAAAGAGAVSGAPGVTLAGGCVGASDFCAHPAAARVRTMITSQGAGRRDGIRRTLLSAPFPVAGCLSRRQIFFQARDQRNELR